MDTLASGAVVMPRALVAISEDRKFLVVLHEPVWIVYEDRPKGYLPRRDIILYTGQDAHEVLAAFLADRGGV
jgi:hypothetical protein